MHLNREKRTKRIQEKREKRENNKKKKIFYVIVKRYVTRGSLNYSVRELESDRFVGTQRDTRASARMNLTRGDLEMQFRRDDEWKQPVSKSTLTRPTSIEIPRYNPPRRKRLISFSLIFDLLYGRQEAICNDLAFLYPTRN